MKLPHNFIGWVEIPVNDMDRAIKFYESVFDIKMVRETNDILDMAFFPWVENSTGSSGSLVYNPEYYKPSADGTLIYLTAFSGDLSIELSRVEKNGGKIIMPKTLIKEDVGYMGWFLDSEGNRIALHHR